MNGLSAAEYRALKARAERSRKSRMVRVRRVAREAGIDPSIPFLHANNAMVAFYAGYGWTGIDYGKVRLVLRLEREIFAADRIVDRLASRRRIGF